MEYKTLEEYVRAHGYELADLTKKELREAKEEMDMINNGIEFLDGLFSSPMIGLRKLQKEQKK